MCSGWEIGQDVWGSEDLAWGAQNLKDWCGDGEIGGDWNQNTQRCYMFRQLHMPVMCLQNLSPNSSVLILDKKTNNKSSIFNPTIWT